MAISGALVLGSQDLATAVVLRLANDRGSAGAVVLYNLAWTVFTVPWAVAAVPLATTAFPGLTAAWQAGERDGYAAAVARTARVMIVVVAAAVALMIATAAPLSRVVVLGAPGHVAPVVLSRALVAFAPGLLGYGFVALLSRALYAQGNARTPAVASIVGWTVAIAVDIALALALPRSWTVAAIGIGTSVGVSVAGGWLFAALRRSTGPEAFGGLPRATVAAVVGGAVAAVTGWGLAAALPADHGVLVNLGCVAAAGLVAAILHAGVAAGLDRSTAGLLLRGRLRRA
jgi:putative peptidoglycan lipid II flippase